MANNEVKIIMTAVDNASSKIKGIDKSFQGLRDNIPGLNNALNLMENPLALAAVGIGAVVAITKKSITETIAYNKQIREMTQVMGLSAEETSRLVQVGETWGITSDEIRTSLAFMNKKGITPNIDALAKMADEYVSSTDKSKWAEEAVKNLGRGYQTLIPLFALGGDGLRKATAAIDKNLIATDKSIAASREYEVGVDKLTKSWTGFKYTVGNEVIPILDKLFTELNNQKTTTQTLREEWEKGIITEKEYAIALRDLRTKGQGIIEVWDGIDKGDKDVITTTDKLTGSVRIATTSIAEQKEAAYDDMNALSKANGLAKAAEEANSAMDIINGTISKLGSTMVEHTKIEAAFELALGLITQAQYNQTVAIADSLGPLEQMAKLVDAGSLSVSYLTSAMADGKVTRDELIAAFMAMGNNAAEAKRKVDELLGTINTIPHVYPIEFPVTVTGQAIPAGTAYNPYTGAYEHQHGANFVVPPGYNENYPLGVASSGERVIVIPKNQTNSTYNFNQTVHTNATTHNIMGNFAMAKAMAG